MAEPMQPRGMVNAGVTCYLNSAMQALASCSALAEVLHTASEVLELPTAQHQTKTDLAREFEDVFRKLRNGGQPGARPVQTNDFVHAVHGLTRALEGLHQQQDTQEFVCALLDTLHEQLKRPLSVPECDEMSKRLSHRWRECTGEEWKDEAKLAYEEQLKKRQEGKGKRDDGITMAPPPPPEAHMSIISHLFEGAQQRAPRCHPPTPSVHASCLPLSLIWACTPSRTHLLTPRSLPTPHIPQASCSPGSRAAAAPATLGLLTPSCLSRYRCRRPSTRRRRRRRRTPTCRWPTPRRRVPTAARRTTRWMWMSPY